MTEKLKYMSDAALSALRSDAAKNPERYLTGDFHDLASTPSWDIALAIDYDPGKLATIDLTQQQSISEIDLINSKIVGEALSELSPSLANEERVWVRLAHTEALEYCRKRWLEGKSGDKLSSSISIHVFAPTRINIRDDQALSRLWWNWHIAKTCWPENVDRALELILSTADVRSNFVERIWMSSRREIASAALRAMDCTEWITSEEQNFREFMKALNRFGGGIVFEALNDEECNGFVDDCLRFAKHAS